MTKQEQLADYLHSTGSDLFDTIRLVLNEVTVECAKENLKKVAQDFKENPSFAFDQLIDVCAVDYLTYGESDWETDEATEQGFSRAVQFQSGNDYFAHRDIDSSPGKESISQKSRFAVVYHLLSTTKNHRIRLKVFLDESNLAVPTVHDLWKSANWFEREAYDLYGILFEGHPDLRRILTDYGFIGHPFRKDFPLSGHVEMRYDALLKKVIYS